MEFFRHYQLDIMQILSGICGLLAFLTAVTKTLSPKRKAALIIMELSSMLLLIADCFAYEYRGDMSSLGFWMVRISNYLVYALSVQNLFGFNMYLKELCLTEGGVERVPRRLFAVDILLIGAHIILIVSQFTGWFYTFDDQNRYTRAPGFVVWYVLPFIVSVFMLTVAVQYYRKLTGIIRISLLIFMIAPVFASIIQLFVYGISITNISMVGTVILLYIFALLDLNDRVDQANRRELHIMQEEQEHLQLVFAQTAEALASAIDAKDRYTHGHSRRVAEYSKRIAIAAGKDEEEVKDVYFAALLHDVGKIGVPDNILNKEGQLTNEEFAAIKTHPVVGKQILSTILELPYLSIGASYHHERYDGKGYPEGLKGEDIPDIARIICVADAYDAMTSKRSYRETMPQQLVREEFVKGIETQFDPVYARIMLHMIDLDIEYRMKERAEVQELSGRTELVCTEYRSAVSRGIMVDDKETSIRLQCDAAYGFAPADCLPSVVLFDSLDMCVHRNEQRIKNLNYFEYGEFRADGGANVSGARGVRTDTIPDRKTGKANLYEIRGVRYRDHLRLEICGHEKTVQFIIAMPDATRYAYIGITGENCRISDLKIEKCKGAIGEGVIPRIADEISYINGPVGDIPNIQIDSIRSDTTKGIPFDKELALNFHSLSMPTARLVWHCPYVILFSSDDGTVKGRNYTEYVVLRADGESWANEKVAVNTSVIDRLGEFTGWDNWKAANKKGVECEVTLKRKGNVIITQVDVSGISATHTTKLLNTERPLYLALSGDQVALTSIKIGTHPVT